MCPTEPVPGSAVSRKVSGVLREGSAGNSEKSPKNRICHACFEEVARTPRSGAGAADEV